MAILKSIILFFILCTQATWAQTYIDQKDPYFIANKIIPSAEESSLCGPVTFMNWLIRENKIKANDARSVLKNLDRAKEGGINYGHTSDQLIALMESVEELTLDKNFYESKSYSQLSLEDVLKNETQIILLKFNRLPKKRSNRFGEPHPFEGMANTLLHYVLKVPSSNGQIQLIDPEQPQRKILISAKEEGGKILLSDEHYKYFGYAGFLEAHEVQVLEVISRKE